MSILVFFNALLLHLYGILLRIFDDNGYLCTND